MYLILFCRGDDLLEQTPKGSNGKSGPTMSCPAKEGERAVAARQIGAVTSLTRGEGNQVHPTVQITIQD